MEQLLNSYKTDVQARSENFTFRSHFERLTMPQGISKL